MPKALVVIIMGSKSDFPFAQEIGGALATFGIPYHLRIASAHKSARHLLDMLRSYESEKGEPRVYITVAGRSNALSGLVDANVTAPVIACPPYSDRFAGADVFSSLRMPGGVAPAVVLEPANAALAAAKILALSDNELAKRVRTLQQEATTQIVRDDRELDKHGRNV